MFAGPNGSGKTTVKRNLRRSDAWFGVYVNADDLEAEVRREGCVRLAPLGLAITTEELRAHFAASTLLASRGLPDGSGSIVCRGDVLDFGRIPFDSYHAAVLADFLRRKALAERRSFSFETVMSSRDKIDFLQESRAAGYRT
jgi:hypothetical protein